MLPSSLSANRLAACSVFLNCGRQNERGRGKRAMVSTRNVGKSAHIAALGRPERREETDIGDSESRSQGVTTRNRRYDIPGRGRCDAGGRREGRPGRDHTLNHRPRGCNPRGGTWCQSLEDRRRGEEGDSAVSFVRYFSSGECVRGTIGRRGGYVPGMIVL